MRFATRYALAAIGGLALLTAVGQLRGMALPPSPVASYLLGVLPNFAAAIAITFVPLSAFSEQNRGASVAMLKRWFFICATISGVGLLAWEVIQRRSDSLVFDPHDIGATFAGLIVSTLLFFALTPRFDQKPGED